MTGPEECQNIFSKKKVQNAKNSNNEHINYWHRLSTKPFPTSKFAKISFFSFFKTRKDFSMPPVVSYWICFICNCNCDWNEREHPLPAIKLHRNHNNAGVSRKINKHSNKKKRVHPLTKNKFGKQMFSHFHSFIFLAIETHIFIQFALKLA